MCTPSKRIELSLLNEKIETRCVHSDLKRNGGQFIKKQFVIEYQFIQ